MNVRQRKFVTEYLKSGNASDAAIKAGYSPKASRAISSRLLTNANVRKALETRLSRYDITADNVLKELALLAYSNMGDYVAISADGQQLVPDFSKLTREQMAAIQEIKVDETAGGAGDGKRERIQRTTFKLVDKGINLERLGRHLKLFTDRLELNAGDEIIKKLTSARKRVPKSQ